MAGAERTKPAAARPCPVCGRPAVVDYRPFCCRRCADVDLGRWLGGRYVIPGDEAADDAPRSPRPPAGDDDGDAG